MAKLKLLAVIILLSGATAFGAAVQACGIITGGSSDGEGILAGYTANLSGQDNEGCNVLITFNSDGSISTTNPNASGAYDTGGDDNEIGIINNTSAPITSVFLSSGSQDIFGFDLDGICGGYTFDGAGPNCGTPTDPSGYAPQGVTFSPVDNFSGTVNFTGGGVPAGGSAFFSLEGPVALDLTVNSGTPEPATFGLIGIGLTGLYFVRRRVTK